MEIERTRAREVRKANEQRGPERAYSSMRFRVQRRSVREALQWHQESGPAPPGANDPSRKPVTEARWKWSIKKTTR
jgi:hypothetical protein